MSEKADVVEEVVEDDGMSGPTHSPSYQYSRKELLEISKNPAARRRPDVLEKAFDSDEGRWDPERWVRAKFGCREPSPLGEGKDRRGGDLDRDLKRRPSSVNDPVERLKENERDGIVLSPQRRSFGTGCHVQPFNRQLSMPERDREREREESRVERERERERGDRERDRDRDRERERAGPTRKIGSGRITIDRENSRDFSNLRDRFDERDRERDRDYNWSRDRGPERDRDWDRERDRDYRDGDWDRDRDRRYDRSDRMRRGGEYSDRRDRDYRGYDRSRRRHYEEKEPEWFTGGPTSQNEVIELRGFEKEGENDDAESGSFKGKYGSHKFRNAPQEEKASKDSASEDVPEADGVQSQCSSPEDDQHTPPAAGKTETESMAEAHKMGHPHHQVSRTSPSNGGSAFDFEQILEATLPLDEENVTKGSRFCQFFAGQPGGKQGSEPINFDDLIPQDLLESRPSPSPTMMGPMGAMQHHHQQFTSYMQHLQLQHQMMEAKEHLPPGFPPHHMAVPNPAGDNGGSVESNKAALPPSVTALFNSASQAGSNASISSPSSFSAQDASAQLKAMLFGGQKDSVPSSGTASPLLPPGIQKKVKTVAELEADMHQDSPKKGFSPAPNTVEQNNSGGDMAAFNKLLIMLNAGSEASHNSAPTENAPGSHHHGMMPSHSEFNHALMRNKEQQMQLLQQSLQGNQQRIVPGQLPAQGVPQGQPDKQQLSMQQLQMQLSQQPPPMSAAHQQISAPPQTVSASVSVSKSIQPGHSLTPQAMSTPQLMSKQPTVTRAQSGGPTSSSDPIFNMIQQHPTIVMNPASPATIGVMGSQSAGPKSARIPSPLMFSQQPPLHLNAPSPIHPGQLSPHSLAVGGQGNVAPNTIPSNGGVRSPVMPRVPSPQEISAHAQAVMFNALLKKQLHDQNERFLKKEQERAKPSPQQQHITVVKPQPAAQPVLPPNPQPKGATLNAFTPTSVLRKMHSDKAVEKEKQAQENNKDRETEFMPSMSELSGNVTSPEEHLETRSQEGSKGKAPLDDLSDISFLDPVNPNLVSLNQQPDGMIRIGQTNILPGGLSHPMSVEEKVGIAGLSHPMSLEEKMKLSILAETPGYLSQMLDKSKAAAEAARTGQGRPIVKGPMPPDQYLEGPESPPQAPHSVHSQLPPNFQQLPQMRGPPPPQSMGGSRPVTGAGPPPGQGVEMPNMVPPHYAPVSSAAGGGGRAIVGGSSVQQMGGAEFMRMMQQQPHSQANMVMPPPPNYCLGPPPVGMPVGARLVPANAVHSAALMQHHQIARANAQRNQQLSQMMAMQQRGLAPLHTVIPPGVAVTGTSALSPQGHSGPLSPAALSATLQRVASPHSAANKMNGPNPSSTSMNGGNSGIQRWFGPDFLRSQLPSMPPLPTQGSHVMTVDELERN